MPETPKFHPYIGFIEPIDGGMTATFQGWTYLIAITEQS